MGFSVENYIVYKVIIEDEIVYIGSGKFGRENHCNSGVSHSYELNKCHHTGVKMDVVIHKMYLSKKESLVLEKELIKSYQPRFNKVHVTKERNSKGATVIRVIKTLKETFCEHHGNKATSYALREGVDSLIKLFCRDDTVFSGWYKLPSQGIAEYSLIDDKASYRLYRKIRDKRYNSSCIEWLGVVFDIETKGCDIYLKVKSEYIVEYDN